MCFFVFVFSHGASQRRPCVRIGLTHAYLSHVKMTLANAKSVNRQTLENVVRNAASEFTRRTAIASLASLRVRVYRGTGVSRGLRRTNWERSLKNWEYQISCFEEFLGGANVLGRVPASLPHTLGYACTFYATTSPPPTYVFFVYRFLNFFSLQEKHINKNTFAGFSRDWVGGKIGFMRFGSHCLRATKTYKQNPPQIPGQSREEMMCVFLR